MVGWHLSLQGYMRKFEIQMCQWPSVRPNIRFSEIYLPRVRYKSVNKRTTINVLKIYIYAFKILN